MKPSFALNLSHEGIDLLHRKNGGWHMVGTVQLDDPQMAETLALLRGTASELSSGGITSKLIIPESQILYTTVTVGTTDPDAQRAEIRAALDGRTPYGVDELVFDWHLDGDVAQVAVLAQETLVEAEAFATEHGFNPVSFAAAPTPAQFPREPFFGPSTSAAALLGNDVQVTPDEVAIDMARITALPIASPAPEVEPEPAPAPEAAPEPVAAPEPAPEAEPDPTPELIAPAPPPVVDDARPAFSTTRSKDAPAAPSARKSAPEDTVAPRLTLGAAEQNSAPRLSAAKRDAGVTSADLPDVIAPVLAEADTTAKPATPAPKPKAGKPAKAKPAKAKTGKSWMLGRPKSPDATAQPVKPAAPEPLSAKPATPAPVVPIPDAAPAVAKIAAKAVKAETPEPAPKAPAKVDKPKDKTPVTTALAPPPPPVDEAEAMTVFGARRNDTPVGGKPKYLGLMLTLVLVLTMGAVALWSVLFSSQDTAGPVDVVPADLVDGAGPTAQSEGTITLSDDGTISTVDDAELADVEPDSAPTAPADTFEITPSVAQAIYATTGVWSLPPEVPDAPGTDTSDDVYVASLDPVITSQDAIALPPSSQIGRPLAPIPQQALPPRPGQVFTLNSDGLILPEAEGAETPYGVTVFSGNPGIAPRPRPVTEQAEPVETTAPDEATPEDGAAAPATDEAPQAAPAADLPPAPPEGVSPRARPDDFADNLERAQNGGLTRSELAAFRPRPRPASLQEQAEALRAQELAAAEAAAAALANAPTTADADPSADSDPSDLGELQLASVPIPQARPSNFDDAVAKALKEAESAAPAAAAAAVPAAAVVTPSIPSSASVAKQATFENEINLSKINLIGVYGSSSDRRALVRLSNGKYVKVQVGDQLDGGQVAAISDDALRYVKRGKNVVLEVPQG